jgi:polyisoprenoid-binding protein YceI
MRKRGKVSRRVTLGIAALLLGSGLLATAQDAFQLDPEQTSVNFTLGDVLHTVHGGFKVKRGALQIDGTGKINGEIVVDAKSGDSGNGMRDRKMNKEVLESTRYPDIAFRPDRMMAKFHPKESLP